MASTYKSTGKASSIPVGIAWGALTSLITTIILSALVAWLVERDSIPEESIGYGVMILLAAAAYAGAQTACYKIKRQKLQVCMISAIIYFLILLSITALFFGGQYSGVGETALMVMCGSMLCALIGTRRKREKNRHKVHIPHR